MKSSEIEGGVESRRSFLQNAALTAAAVTVSLGRSARAESANTDGSKTKVETTRKLGNLQVSSVGLGCQDFTGTFYATAPTRSDMIQLARNAHERGVTLFDMAEAYGPLEVERIVGEALKPVRGEVIYSSKFGWDIDLETGRMRGGLNSRPEHIRVAVDGMLKRLQTDHLDLLYQHRVDPKVPIEDVAGTVRDLIRQGKVLHFGLSEPGPETLRRAHAVQPVSAVQNEYSIMALDPQEQILPICKELGIGFVCWSPLAMGLLTGTITPETQFARGDFRAMVPWFAPENLAANLQRVGVVETWARRKNATPGQVSLAWLAAQAPWVVTIPGTTKMPHMLENKGADTVRFSSAELAAFNADLTRTPVKGARLPQGVLGLSGVEAPKKQA